MKMKSITKTLLSSTLTIALSLSMIGGATYALFTDKSEVNVSVTSGKVDVTAVAKDLEVYSPTAIDYDTKEIVNDANAASGNTFVNGGTAVLDGGTLTLNKIAPGDHVNFNIDFANQSNIAAKYRVTMTSSGSLALVSGLEISIRRDIDTEERSFTRIAKYISEWRGLSVDKKAIETLHIQVELPADRGNDYQNLQCKLHFAIEAVQGNTDVHDASGITGEAYVEYLELVYTGEELRNKVAAVPAGATKTFILGQDIKTAALSEKDWGNPYGVQGDTVIENKNIGIDLNGYTMTMNNTIGVCAVLKNNASLTIKSTALNEDGTVKKGKLNAYKTKAQNAVNPMFFVGGTGTGDSANVDSLTLENVDVVYDATKMTDSKESGRAWGALIQTNASNAYASSNISVKDVNFDVKGPMATAIYLPNRGDRSFIDSSITGDGVSTSFFVCGGNLNITGGSYVGNKYEYVNSDQTLDIQSKIIDNTDAFWNGPATIGGESYANGIVGYNNGPFATGDAICIVVRQTTSAPQGYVLGDVTIKNVKFVLGKVELSAEEQSNAAEGTVLSGPSGYAVRYYDSKPNMPHGNISIAIADSLVTGREQTIKGATSNTTKLLHSISLCEKDVNGNILKNGNGTSITREARAEN